VIEQLFSADSSRAGYGPGRYAFEIADAVFSMLFAFQVEKTFLRIEAVEVHFIIK
jgi:hypothetical protein